MKKIHLLRHFKVKDLIAGGLDSKEFDDWVRAYDDMDIYYLDIHIPKVDKVYTSPQKRAIKTAELLHLRYTVLNDLQEVEAGAFIDTKSKFSKGFWLMIGRVLWFFNISKIENKKDSIQRAKAVIDTLLQEKDNDILIISHGLFMTVLIQQLKTLGYEGETDISPKNGKLYTLAK